MKPCTVLLPTRWLPLLALLLTLGLAAPAGAETAKHGEDAKHGDEAKKDEKKDDKKEEKKIELPLIKMPKADVSATSADNPKEVGNQVREALGTSVPAHKKLTVIVNSKGAPAYTEPANITGSQQYRQARAAALGLRLPPTDKPEVRNAESRWTYEGDNGPQNWARLSPEFNLCAIGKRQSPISIQDDSTLQGPAEGLQFTYKPSEGSVLNNGHTILVEVNGENTLTVRGSTYRLVQIHFHTPSEEEINFKHTAMVAHLVHKSDEGKLAVIAVLLEVGTANPLIDKVWTYMPLDTSDRVRMPKESLNLNEIMPADQRYYQFMGSMTEPPCTEGVLWVVIKQPLSVSRAQFKLFTQIFPMNARPVQAVNGRPVRQAQ